MKPLKTYEYLTKARGRLFDWVRPRSEEEYARVFPIGLGTLGRTLTHIMTAEWAYSTRISGGLVPRYELWPIKFENPPPFAELEALWVAQGERTRGILSAVRDWETDLEYKFDGDGAPQIINASPSDIFTQLVLHEVHHRAQAMNMLKQLGVAAEDLDYNELMYKRRAAEA